MPVKWLIVCVVWITGSSFLLGCATHQAHVSKAKSLIYNHEYQAAADVLKPFAEKPSDDQLVYLFEYATALQLAGDYTASNKYLLISDDLVGLKDYHSISRIGGSLLFNEGMVQYKGEDYERLMINVMAALNFLMLQDRENALVSVRRLNDKLEYFRIEEKKQYEQNAFALYLSGLLWEGDRDYDSAYINYEKAYKANPSIKTLESDLVRVSRLARRDDSFEKWSKKFNIRPHSDWTDKNKGELVLIFQQGWGPKKGPHPNAPRFPKLYAQSTMGKLAKLSLVGTNFSAITEPVYSVQDVAIKTLDDAYAGLIAKRAAGFVAKEVVAKQVSKDNELLGAALWVTMHLSDQADLRQWSTLPESFQVARVFLPAGNYKATVSALDSSGASETGEKMPEVDVVIKPQKKTFIQWRSLK